MKKLFLIFAFCLLPFALPAADLFDKETPVIDGIKVLEASDTFAEIFEKLDSANFGGKDIRAAIESLETLGKGLHIAATDHRIVIVKGDQIIGNWARPVDRDWQGFGQVTTALLLKMREADAGLRRQSQSTLYSMSVSAMTSALDAGGRFVASRAEDSRVLTSAGLQGKRDNRGYWRVTGVFKGSQADVAGINDSDLIIGINGVDVAQMSDAELAAALAGFNSGTLKLKVASPSGTKDLSLRRATIVMADADIIARREVPDEKREIFVLEIIINNVSENSVEIVNQALASYKNPNGIILDLRTAGGGDERAAAKLAGLFLGQVPVMRIDEGNGEEVEVIPGGDSVTDAPMIILVSGSTQGAAEGVAAALYENRRGVLIGTPTAGFARLVTRIELTNGGVIELGNRSIKSGQGMKIDGRGIFPLVCLSNIRNKSQQDAFFINAVNGDFNLKDFNKDDSADPAAIRKGCPEIKSGSDEDAMAAAIAMKFLTDKTAYARMTANDE
ncbi:MAG: S41 family peptidase [Alphaproteobacteria bacterium]|nr:S41 family peptidase [Alphaproteobacteria bacterium]